MVNSVLCLRYSTPVSSSDSFSVVVSLREMSSATKRGSFWAHECVAWMSRLLHTVNSLADLIVFIWFNAFVYVIRGAIASSMGQHKQTHTHTHD